MKIALWYLAAITIVTFCVCGWDKYAAQRQLRRVPEKILFLLSATQHWYFKFGIPAIIVAQAAAVMLVLRWVQFPLK